MDPGILARTPVRPKKGTDFLLCASRGAGAGVVVCLERGADLHTAQLMPLPLTVSCFSKIRIGFTFLVPAHPGSPGKGPLNGCECVLCFHLC